MSFEDGIDMEERLKGKMSLKTENWMGGYQNECYRNLLLVYGK
jgi:hypothetical protein